MGKASRRQRRADHTPAAAPAPAPFVRRPFEGLPGETDWVALREIVPAATVTVRLNTASPGWQAAAEASRGEPGASAVEPSPVPEPPESATVSTVLPFAWPGLRRRDGALVLGLQAGQAGGDVSRGLAAVLLALLRASPGAPVTLAPAASADTPRLQDLVDLAGPFEVRLHEGFDFWVPDIEELVDDSDAAHESLERANAAVIPTVKLAAAESAYWCRIGDRAHLRWVLPLDEDQATDALARLHAAGADTLGPGTRLLGAFRACGLLAPVWDLDPAAEPASYEPPLTDLVRRLAEAMSDQPLDAGQRRAKAGLLSRQLTLR